EAGNDKEYFDPHPAEPRERRSGGKLNVGGDVMVETGRSAYRRPGPGPEHQVKNGYAEGSSEAQRIQQWEMIFHGNLQVHETGSSSKFMKQCRCEYRIRSASSLTKVTHHCPASKGWGLSRSTKHWGCWAGEQPSRA